MHRALEAEAWSGAGPGAEACRGDERAVAQCYPNRLWRQRAADLSASGAQGYQAGLDEGLLPLCLPRSRLYG